MTIVHSTQGTLSAARTFCSAATRRFSVCGTRCDVEHVHLYRPGQTLCRALDEQWALIQLGVHAAEILLVLGVLQGQLLLT